MEMTCRNLVFMSGFYPGGYALANLLNETVVIIVAG